MPLAKTVWSAMLAFALITINIHAKAQSTINNEETVESLQRKLAAQQAINQQLRQRVDALERELTTNRRSTAPIIVGLDTQAAPPTERPISDKPVTAIEEALIEKGVTLLPAGSFQATPYATWVNNGSGPTRQNSYAAGLALEAGLPWGMSASIRQPYIWRNYAIGSQQGFGDFSISLAKKLNNETNVMPSFVARMTYSHNSGDKPFPIYQPSIGAGLSAYNFSLSAVKRADPVVFYGIASYTHQPSKNFSIDSQDLNIAPGDTWGLDLGVSLAATPDVSLDAGLAFAFSGGDRYRLDNGRVLSGERSTKGYISLGTGIRLTRNLFLSITGAAGVTEDAQKFIFSVSLPYRF